jgi:hypothetical protein
LGKSEFLNPVGESILNLKSPELEKKNRSAGILNKNPRNHKDIKEPKSIMTMKKAIGILEN